MKVGKRTWIFASVAVALACTPTIVLPSGPPAGGASQVVDQTGGTVTTADGTTLVIPAGALAGPTTITITLEADAAPPAGTYTVTTVHDFEPAGLGFLVPVCITLSFEPGLMPFGTTQQDVVLYQSVPDGGAGQYRTMQTIAAGPTQVMGTTTVLSTVVAAYGGGAQEVPADAGIVTCDASDAEAGD